MAGSWGVDPLNVAVSNLPVTQPVSGSVSVSNLPATQPVSGTVTSSPLSAESLSASGRTTSATAGLALVTFTTPAAGTYRVRVSTKFTGGSVTAATDMHNMEIRVAGSSKFVCMSTPSSTTTVPVNYTEGQITVNGSQDITLTAIAAATLASEYSYSAILTRIA